MAIFALCLKSKEMSLQRVSDLIVFEVEFEQSPANTAIAFTYDYFQQQIYSVTSS